MGKSFWVVLCIFGLGLFVSVFAACAYEEYRWQRVVENVEQLNHNTKEYVAAINRLAEALPAAVAAGEKMKDKEPQRQEYEALKEKALNMIARRRENPEKLWRVVPDILEVLDRERKTSLRNLLFSVLTLALAVFVAIAAVKTKKRFTLEATALAKLRDEIGRSNANLVGREQKLLRDQDRLAADSTALEKRREVFEQERRKFRREVLKFQHEHPSNEDVPADPGSGIANQLRQPLLPAAPSTGTEATTLTPWKLWLTFSQGDDGQPLPQGKTPCIEVLQAALDKTGLRSLKAERVYKSLLFLVLHLEEVRQRIGEVGYTKLAGWKKWRVGKRHRFNFLRVGEYEIRFLPPVPRKDAYRRGN